MGDCLFHLKVAVEMDFADDLDSGQVNVDLAVSLGSQSCGIEQRAMNRPQSPEQATHHQVSRSPGGGACLRKSVFVHACKCLRPRESLGSAPSRTVWEERPQLSREYGLDLLGWAGGLWPRVVSARSRSIPCNAMVPVGLGREVGQTLPEQLAGLGAVCPSGPHGPP